MFKKSKVIASIKGFINVWLLLKLLLILICFVWFYLNVIQIIKRYLEFNTMVVVEYKQPNQTQLPAVTVCADSFISDDRLSEYYWEDWLNYTNTKSREDKYEIRSMLRNMEMDSKTVREIFDDNSITYESLISSCYFYPSFKYQDGIPCTNITTVVESMHSGRKCYTLFNELNITEKRFPIKLIEYKMQSFIEIILVNQSQSYYRDHLLNETVIFAIHSANFIP